MWQTSLAAIGLASLLAVSSARAEDAALEGILGAGVEAYYTGNYVQAFNLLNGAVQAGSHDPRVYYFRGLAETYLGRMPDAERDFQKGAELETSEVTNVVDVGRSLERVQGSRRLLLERYRAAARLAAAAERERMRVLRYGNVRPSAMLPPAQSAGVSPAAPAAQAPAAEPAAPEQKPAADNPFGAPAAGAQKPAAEDPFAAPAKPPAEDPFATPPKQ